MRLFFVLWNWKNLINVCVDFIASREQLNVCETEREIKVWGIILKLCRLRDSGLRFTVKYNKQAGFELIKRMLSRALFNLFENACFPNWIGFLFCGSLFYGDPFYSEWNYFARFQIFTFLRVVVTHANSSGFEKSHPLFISKQENNSKRENSSICYQQYNNLFVSFVAPQSIKLISLRFSKTLFSIQFPF